MNIYRYDEIKERADCREIAKALGVNFKQESGEWWRSDSPWRPGSDSGAFCVSGRGWKDQVSGEHGSVIDLVAKVKFNGDIFSAQDWLGQQLQLSPRHALQADREFVCAYRYVDMEGALRHETVRYRLPNGGKEFSQRRPNPDKPGEWIWSLKGIDPILYRMKDWMTSPWVCIVGGEKDADNLLRIGVPATTNPMGEGKWRGNYNEFFKGKRVAIIPDNDEVGRAHAQNVASQLFDWAAEVRIVTLPGLPAKGDASDFLEAGHGKADIIAQIKASKTISDGEAKPSPIDQNTLNKAKVANQAPFRNYEWVTVQGNGASQRRREAIHVSKMATNIFERFLGFPVRIGNVLFDQDKETKKIRMISDHTDLFAWIEEKSGKRIDWSAAVPSRTKGELFSAVLANAREYMGVSCVPTWPSDPNVFCTVKQLPDPHPEHYYFERFCAFFNPSEETDRIGIRVMTATAFWSALEPRPLFVVGSDQAQGAGKTTLTHKVAQLSGGDDPQAQEVLDIPVEQLNNESTYDRVVRRLLSAGGRRKKIVLFDNVTGFLRSAALARLVTMRSISGMPPYGKTEETRLNTVLYVMTSNAATLDRDLVHRACFVNVKPSKPDPGWSKRVDGYIAEYRLNIIADLFDILSKGAQFAFEPQTRRAAWEADIVAPMCGTLENYRMFMATMAVRCESADGDADQASILRDHFATHLRSYNIDPASECVWLQSPVIQKWAASSIDGFGGRTGAGAIQKIRIMIGQDLFPELGTKPEVYPARSVPGGPRRARGLMWNPTLYEEGEQPRILTVNTEGDVKEVDWVRDDNDIPF